MINGARWGRRAWTMLLARLFEHLIRRGRLRVVDAAGKSWDFGESAGGQVVIRLYRRATQSRLFFNPDFWLGESYLRGDLTLEQGSIHDFLVLCCDNMGDHGLHPVAAARQWVDGLFRRVQQFNPIPLAGRNVAHHYDLSGRLYDLFLDADRQYSCAYFAAGDEDLETAQALKKRHIAAKLRLRAGQRVLDIGSGWGGLPLYLAGHCGANVTGVTLSAEQLDLSRRRAAESGFADRLDYQLRDYREVDGRFDRIVSVGMFEHVGINHYGAFFGKLRDLLADDGVALLHSIGRLGRGGATNPWFRRYIFPGGYNPSLSEIVAAVEGAGLMVTDVEVLRGHYAKTLKLWRRRFHANRDNARALYDERFCRMWEFYLSASECAFRYLDLAVFQVQLAKRSGSLPINRAYMAAAEAALAAWEEGAETVKAGAGGRRAA